MELASPRAILLPLNLTLVKFILNFTPTLAITYTYTPSSRQRLAYKNDIPLLRRLDVPLLRGRNYPCSVCLIDLLRIHACQRVHVVKVVGLNFVSFIAF